MTHWVNEELAAIDLKDKRLDKRSAVLLGRLSEKPELSIPAACLGGAETAAAYRFFNNPAVTPDAILAAHREATHKRIAQHPVALLLQDTTEVDYTGKTDIAGLGPLNYENRVGAFIHTTLAVTPERVPLGVIAAKFWARQPGVSAARQHKQKPLEEKESYRWLQGYQTACETARATPGTTIVNICDREGDIYDLFVEAEVQAQQGVRAEFVIRSCQNRNLPQQKEGETSAHEKLWAHCQAAPLLGSLRFTLPKSGERSARTVRQVIRATTLELKAPWRTDRKLPNVRVGIVLASEIDPPEGEKPIEWLLLTSLPLDTFAAAEQVLAYYLARWSIEIFFRVLKSGSKVESLQLETTERLYPCLALYMIVSWRTMLITMLSRSCPDQPCTVLFAEEEWRSVYMMVKGSPAPARAVGLNAFVRMLASLGGFLNRKGDGEPGPKTVWVGLQRMADFAAAWRIFGSQAPETCVER